MALYTVKGSANIPEGAVRVSKEKALEYQKALVRDWDKELDVFFLRYSRHMAMVLTMVSSIVVSNHFRKMLKLGSRGKFLIAIPGVFLPSVFPVLYFDKYITDKVLLLQNDCPMCFLFPFGLVQVLVGVVQPSLVGFSSGMSIAKAASTIYVPDTKTETKKFFSFVFNKVIKPGGVKFQILTAVHILSMLYFPYMQNKELLNIMAKAEVENELEKEENVLN